MLNAQFDGDVLVLRPDGPITREDVAALTRTADEYLAGHAKISGVMVRTQNFPASRAWAHSLTTLASLPTTMPACGASRWSLIQPSPRSRSSWPTMLLALKCGTIHLPTTRRRRHGSGCLEPSPG
jgi:hypothetical protein